MILFREKSTKYQDLFSKSLYPYALEWQKRSLSPGDRDFSVPRIAPKARLSACLFIKKDEPQHLLKRALKGILFPHEPYTLFSEISLAGNRYRVFLTESWMIYSVNFTTHQFCLQVSKRIRSWFFVFLFVGHLSTLGSLATLHLIGSSAFNKHWLNAFST